MFSAPAVFPALVITLALVCSFSNGVQAGCFLERGVTTPGEHDVYTCIRSQDIQKDLEALPLAKIKQVNIVFRDGKIPKIGKETFKKLGNKVLGISIVHCGVEDVDEDAFQGLTELKGLILRRNRLTEVKKGWFKDLSKLESLDLSGNMIHEFDPVIFDHTPMIQEFEISENLLKAFHVDTMKTKWLKLKKVGLQWNPYEWSQGVKVIEYSNSNPSIVKNSYASVDGIRDTAKIVKECHNTISNKDDVKELDNCVQAKLTKAIENPKILEGEKPAK